MVFVLLNMTFYGQSRPKRHWILCVENKITIVTSWTRVGFLRFRKLGIFKKTINFTMVREGRINNNIKNITIWFTYFLFGSITYVLGLAFFCCMCVCVWVSYASHTQCLSPMLHPRIYYSTLFRRHLWYVSPLNYKLPALSRSVSFKTWLVFFFCYPSRISRELQTFLEIWETISSHN